MVYRGLRLYRLHLSPFCGQFPSSFISSAIFFSSLQLAIDGSVAVSLANMSKPTSLTGSESEFEFIETPKATPPVLKEDGECGVRTTEVNPRALELPLPPCNAACLLPLASANQIVY